VLYLPSAHECKHDERFSYSAYSKERDAHGLEKKDEHHQYFDPNVAFVNDAVAEPSFQVAMPSIS
jgi:hypothetical protein